MNPTKSCLAVTLAAALLAASAAAWPVEGPPVAPVRPVTDTYFGTPVVDNYRYMENLKDPEVQRWMKAQATYTRKVLDSIPGRNLLAQRLLGLAGKDLRRDQFTRRGDRLFYEVMEPGANLAKLAYRDGVDGAEHILVDPARLTRDSAHHYALDWYSPSWDGRYVAYGVSEGGSEQSVLHIVDLTTGKVRAESIDRTSDCVVSWRNDNASFFYLRYPRTGPDTPPALTEYNAVTYLHVLGQRPNGDGDEAVFGHGVSAAVDVPEGQGTYVLLSPDSPYAVAVANRNMDNAPNSFFVVPLDQIHGAQTPWQKIAEPDDGVTDVHLRGDRLYFLSEKGASRFQILSTPLAQPDVAHAEVVVPEGQNVLDSFSLGSDAIYIGERAGASFELQRVSFDGKDSRTIRLPFAGTVGDLGTDPRAPGVMFNLQGWVRAPREIAYDPKTDAATDTGLIPASKTESADVEAHDEFATSYDGTRIPVSIIAQKGVQRDGTHPTIVFGYASYGTSMDPYYDPAWQAWIAHGGIVAVSHMRGGGEYGDAWHRAGQKLTKINTMLDFIASAQYMIDQHYTQSKFLVANSASAGGIVMGGALEIDPGLFHVILDDVGDSDTLRSETEPNGPPNVPEFGSTTNEPGFHGLYAMSAYAHVHDGTPYPAVMFTTGANDPRVSSWHMLKMAARVQAATSSGRPVLLRIDYDAGHGIGSSLTQYANELADEWSFALWQMGEPGFQPKH
ncbi:MAG TPA: prolyl oligopeptidase family serine peptidase [Paraburkholderia sp.]|nr:prolyl oligopeptidase family serine peptidase [Paraburkholderia sp.]